MMYMVYTKMFCSVQGSLVGETSIILLLPLSACGDLYCYHAILHITLHIRHSRMELCNDEPSL